MEIKIAKHAGFCFGVTKAIEKAFSSVDDKNIKKPLYSLGHIVHNTHVVNDLEKKGVTIVSDIKEINTEGTLIISAHGVAPQIFEAAEKKGLQVIDTTCIKVKKVQELAQNLKKEGFFIVIIGDPNHPEVKGVKEWAGNNSLIIPSKDAISKIDFSQKIGILAQTTITKDQFESISESIKSKAYLEVKAFNTICNATNTRQKAARELAKEVDIMLIIGDTKSANTKKLYEISKQIISDSYLISNLEDIDIKWFNKKSKIGITAGASTPQSIIDAVVNKLGGL